MTTTVLNTKIIKVENKITDNCNRRKFHSKIKGS